MPLEPHEELKLSWEVAVMEMQIDRGRVDIEKLRLEVDKTHAETQKILQDLKVDRTHVETQKMMAETQKILQDLRLDNGRLKVQVWAAVGAFMTGCAALIGTGIAIGHFFTK